MFCFKENGIFSHLARNSNQYSQHKVLIGTSVIVCACAYWDKYPSDKEIKAVHSSESSALQQTADHILPASLCLSLVKGGGGCSLESCHLFPSIISLANRGWLSTVSPRSTGELGVSSRSLAHCKPPGPPSGRHHYCGKATSSPPPLPPPAAPCKEQVNTLWSQPASVH